MRNCALWILVLVCLAVACRRGAPVSVKGYWGHTTERPAVDSTFDWWTTDEEPLPDAVQADERITHLVRQIVQDELCRIGYRKRYGETTPTFFVITHLGRGFQPSPQGPEDRATLAVEIRAGDDGRLIYLGHADAVVDTSLNPEERKSRIERAIQEILKPFAPCDP